MDKTQGSIPSKPLSLPTPPPKKKKKKSAMGKTENVFRGEKLKGQI
jgi:hypothetical protein